MSASSTETMQAPTPTKTNETEMNPLREIASVMMVSSNDVMMVSSIDVMMVSSNDFMMVTRLVDSGHDMS